MKHRLNYLIIRARFGEKNPVAQVLRTTNLSPASLRQLWATAAVCNELVTRLNARIISYVENTPTAWGDTVEGQRHPENEIVTVVRNESTTQH